MVEVVVMRGVDRRCKLKKKRYFLAVVMHNKILTAKLAHGRYGEGVVDEDRSDRFGTRRLTRSSARWSVACTRSQPGFDGAGRSVIHGLGSPNVVVSGGQIPVSSVITPSRGAKSFCPFLQNWTSAYGVEAESSRSVALRSKA